jgi:hypothetical protein
MPKFEYDDDDDLFEEYQRYVQSANGEAEDYDTWVDSVYHGKRRRAAKKPKPGKFDRYDD